MLDSTKHNFREKLLKCIQEGTEGLSKRTDNLEKQLADTSNTLTKKIDGLMSTINNHRTEKTFISPEYTLDSLQRLHTNKPRILICGYYGARNLGDELMLQSILKRLNPKKLDITILLAPCSETDASIYAPYNVIHYPTHNDDILLLAKNYDYIIWGGGAVLDDSDYHFNYLNNALGYILLKVSLAAFQFNKKVYIFGVSTNHIIRDQIFISDLQKVINKADYFSLRDTNSLKTLQDIQIDTKKVNIIDDIAILDLPTSLPKNQSQNLSIGLVFIFDNKNLDSIISFIKLLIICFPNKSVTMNFIPFFDENNYDQKHFQKILSSVNIPKNINASIKPFANNIDELIQIISQCDCIFSMRYHATLISSLCGIKTLSIDYSEEHRHYRNKLSYIKEHYNDFEVIPSSSIANKKLVFNAIEQTLAQVTHGINSQVIKSANKTLSQIIAQIN